MRNNVFRMGSVIKIVPVLVVVLSLVLIVVSYLSRNRSESPVGGGVYPLVAVVREVDRAEDTVLFEDSTGHRWRIRGAEDWQVGDCAGLLMNDNGTSSVRDDTVIAARYSAWSVR